MREKEDIWFVGDSIKTTLGNLLSILIGVIYALGIMFPFAFIAIFMMFSFEDIPLITKVFSFLIFISGIILGSFTGGYFTSIKSINNQNLNIFLTSLILIIILLKIDAFSIIDFEYQKIIIPIIIVFAAFLGRKKEVSNP